MHDEFGCSAGGGRATFKDIAIFFDKNEAIDAMHARREFRESTSFQVIEVEM